jgi:hypothetical protein
VQPDEFALLQEEALTAGKAALREDHAFGGAQTLRAMPPMAFIVIFNSGETARETPQMIRAPAAAALKGALWRKLKGIFAVRDQP